MTLSRGKMIAAGAVTLLLGLIALFPARVAYQWFAPPGIALNGISGTVWSGRAAQASVQGVYLEGLAWEIRPLALIKGQLAMSIEGIPGSGFVETTLTVGFSGTVQFDDLQGSLPLQSLERLVRMPGLRGNASVQFERLAIRDGLPVAADGVLTVSSLVAPMIHRGSIGGYRAEFFTQNAGVMASVEDTDGVVDLAGSLQIAADRTFRFTGLVASKATTPPNLLQQMQFLEGPNERGQYTLPIEGKL
ncbi:MAG TPA: type II secretion system protein N [Woeseiaceae bacterium]|nr:type II secretion system protein N [Woeseiaceae bacterium]